MMRSRTGKFRVDPIGLFLRWLVGVGVLGATFAARAESSWIRLRTPHFDVVSEASEKDTRSYLVEMERCLAAFTQIPHLLPRGWAPETPIRVVVVRQFGGPILNAGDLLETTWFPGELGAIGLLRTTSRAYLLEGGSVVKSRPESEMRTAIQGAVLDVLLAHRKGSWPEWLRLGTSSLLRGSRVGRGFIECETTPFDAMVGEVDGNDLQAILEAGPDWAKLIESVGALRYPLLNRLLVHFLFCGLQPEESARLGPFLREIEAGKDGLETFEKELGIPVGDLPGRLNTFRKKNSGKSTRLAFGEPVPKPSAKPESVPAPPGLAAAWIATQAAELGFGKTVLGMCAEARRLGGAEAWVQLAEGRLSLGLTNWSEAQGHFRKALELQPEDSLTRHQLARSLVHPEASKAETEEARAILRQLVERHPDRPGPWYDLGIAEYALDESRQRTLDCFSKAVDLDPDFHRARYMAALTLIRAGEPRLARGNLIRVVRACRKDTRLVELARESVLKLDEKPR